MKSSTWNLGGILAYICLLHRTNATIKGWSTPTIANNADGTGTLTILETQATLKTIKTYVATSDVTGTIEYTLKTADTPFMLSTGGELSITANLDAEKAPTYTLEIQAKDAESKTGVATITVTVTGKNVAPAFSKTSFTQCIADKSPVETSLITVLATDENAGDKIKHSIDAAGNTNTDFKIDVSTGAITVNTGKTLNMATTAIYTLVVKAEDNASPPKTGSTTVSVEVTANGTCNAAKAKAEDNASPLKTGSTTVSVEVTADGTRNAATAVVVSIMTILMALVVTL